MTEVEGETEDPNIVVSGIEFLLLQSLSCFPKAYWRITPKYYRWRASSDVRKFKNPPDPFKIEFVNPDRITHMSLRDRGFHRNRRVLYGSVKSGNWDRSRRAFEETSFHRSMVMHYRENIPWEETPLFRESIQSGKSRDTVVDRFERIDDLYKNIKSNGYIPQYKLLSEKPRSNDGLFLDTLDEVTVNVSRSGELLHVDGMHRLSIAKIQNIDRIPIVFLIRHGNWMKMRERISSSEKIPDHPDLRDLRRKEANERWKPSFIETD